MLRHARGFALANKGHDTRALEAIGMQECPAHGALHRAGSRSVQEPLARIATKRNQVLPLRADLLAGLAPPKFESPVNAGLCLPLPGVRRGARLKYDKVGPRLSQVRTH